jgi:hypothetical protein
MRPFSGGREEEIQGVPSEPSDEESEGDRDDAHRDSPSGGPARTPHDPVLTWGR